MSPEQPTRRVSCMRYRTTSTRGMALCPVWTKFGSLLSLVRRLQECCASICHTGYSDTAEGAGYMGHVPGYGSGNLHGSPWHDLLSPTHRDSATSPFPMVRQPLSTPRSRPASASVDGRGSRVKIPNNIAGYLKKKGGSAGSRPTSAR